MTFASQEFSQQDGSPIDLYHASRGRPPGA